MTFDVEVLRQKVGLGIREFMAEVGWSYTRYKRVHEDGMDPFEADRLAIRFGWHPSLVWADWGPDDPAVVALASAARYFRTAGVA